MTHDKMMQYLGEEKVQICMLKHQLHSHSKKRLQNAGSKQEIGALCITGCICLTFTVNPFLALQQGVYPKCSVIQ